jgi:hypothetical protein
MNRVKAFGGNVSCLQVSNSLFGRQFTAKSSLQFSAGCWQILHFRIRQFLHFSPKISATFAAQIFEL